MSRRRNDGQNSPPPLPREPQVRKNSGQPRPPPRPIRKETSREQPSRTLAYGEAASDDGDAAQRALRRIGDGGLTHVGPRGEARMVDVSGKPESAREATASGSVLMSAGAFALVRDNGAKKGDVLGVARIAAIQAAKRTSDLVPLCHPLRITHIAVDCSLDEERSAVRVTATVRTADRTGVEMEALTAAAVGCLTVYDMVKAADRAMTITDVRLEAKSGGRSGAYSRKT